MVIPFFTCQRDLALLLIGGTLYELQLSGLWKTLIFAMREKDLSYLSSQENKTCQKHFCFNGIRTYELSNSSEYCTHWAIKLTWRWWHCVTQHTLIGTLRNKNAEGGEGAIRSGEIQKVNWVWLEGDLIKFCIRTQREWSSFCVVWKREVFLSFPLLCQQRGGTSIACRCSPSCPLVQVLQIELLCQNICKDSCALNKIQRDSNPLQMLL